MSATPVVVYLDHALLGDVPFLQSLARALAAAGPDGPRGVLVHGSGEEAERMLEGEGFFPERVDGLLRTESAEEEALVAQAIRLANRRVVGLLTDAVVASVGALGPDRGLLRREADGSVGLRRVEWITELAARRVYPVIGALARDAADGGEREVRLADVAARFATEMGAAVVFFTTTNLPGLMDGRTPRPEARIADLLGGSSGKPVVREPESVLRVQAQGLPILVTNTTRLADRKGPSGTWIVP